MSSPNSVPTVTSRRSSPPSSSPARTSRSPPWPVPARLPRSSSCSSGSAEEQIRRLSSAPGTELQIASLEDRVASLAPVYVWAVDRGARTTSRLRAAIETLFTEEDGKQVTLSTIHRAKGL
jgi:hypothetical protein